MHMRYPKPSSAVACPDCGSEFTSIGNLNRHVRMSHAEQPPRVPCDMCEKTFNSKGGLNRHKRQRHTTQSPIFDCPECSSVFASRGNLNRHMRMNHLGQPSRVPCDICGKTFNCREGLNRHRQQRHSIQSPMVSCPHCGSEFTGRGNLNRHMRMSHAEQGWSKTTKSERDDQQGSLPSRPIFSPEAWISNPLIPPDFGPSQRLIAGNRNVLWPAVELKPSQTINAIMQPQLWHTSTCCFIGKTTISLLKISWPDWNNLETEMSRLWLEGWSVEYFLKKTQQRISTSTSMFKTFGLSTWKFCWKF